MSEREEAAYWKRVACWMGDVIAATATHQLMLKSTGKGERERQMNIARMAADALEGKNLPTVRSVETVAARLRRVA